MSQANIPRCDYSDLPREWCAHCTGAVIDAGAPRRWDDTKAPTPSPRSPLARPVVFAPRLPKKAKRPEQGCYRDGEGDWLVDVHEDDCTDGDTCRGCAPCRVDGDGNPTRHCAACRGVGVHLGTGELVCPYCVADTRADLATIEQLYALMPTEAVHHGVDSEAAALAGPVPDVGQWLAERAAAIAGGWWHGAVLEWLDPHHPLTVLGWWDMAIREDYDSPTDERVTVTGAVAYLSSQLTAIARDPHQDFPVMAKEIRTCRVHLETVGHDSRTPELGAPCPRCPADEDRKPPRLVHHRNAADTTGAQDRWVCPANGAHWWYEADYRLRVGQDHLKHARELTMSDMSKRLGIAPGTLRRWASTTRVDGEDVPPLLNACGRSADQRKLYRVADVEALRDQRASRHQESRTV